MKFDMDISSVSILQGASVNTKQLGTWKAGLDTNLTIKDETEMKNLTAAVVYRIYTVVVSNYNVSRMHEFKFKSIIVHTGNN